MSPSFRFLYLGFTNGDQYTNLYFSSNTSLLFHAARNGHTDIFKYICKFCRIDPAMQHNYKGIQNVSNEDTLHYIRTYVDPLHEAAIKGDLDKVKYYIESKNWSPLLQDRHGNNVLHNAAEKGQLEVIKYTRKLYSTLLIRNKQGLLPEELALTNDFFNVTSYIKLISNKVVNIKCLPFTHTVLVMGNSSSGKSTLIKSIMNKKSLLGRYRQVRGVAPSTAGVVPHIIEDDEIGSLKIYDFAGHEEYYASHENILQHIAHPLVLLVVDISLPIREIKKQLSYWLTVIGNASSQQSLSVLVIASHIDNGNHAKMNSREASRFLKETMNDNFSSINYHKIVQCDCRYSGTSDMKKLLVEISHICKYIHINNLTKESNDVNRFCISLKTYLECNKDKLPPLMKFSEIFERLMQDKKSDSSLDKLSNKGLLIKGFELLHSIGYLIYILDDTSLDESLLIYIR